MAYNIVPFHGKKARVEKGNVKIDFSTDWSIQAQVDMADGTRQGQDWKESLAGCASWSGSMNYQLVLGNTQQKALVDNIITAVPGTKLTDMKFLLDSDTNALTGDIFLTSLNITSSVGDIVKGSFNFQGNGPLSVTNAA